jgi:LytS/YehU family sensor histidine kinase
VSFTLLHAAALGLTHGLRRVMRRQEWSSLGIRQLAWRCVAVSCAFAVPMGIASTLTPVGVVHGPPDAHVPGVTMAVNILNWAFLFMAWLTIYFTVIGLRQRRDAALRQSELARALQQAELRLLKSQLNPHFLFNALNAVRSLIAEDPTRAQRAVTRLANTLRYTLGAGQNELVSLARELEIVADYLELEKIRFEERLTIESEVAPDTGTAQIPTMLLQTVVENAIKHGIAELPAGGAVRIRACIQDGTLVLDVENPRPPVPPRSAREGTGLRNAEERLRLLFGAGASLRLDLSEPALATTRIRIPQHS